MKNRQKKTSQICKEVKEARRLNIIVLILYFIDTPKGSFKNGLIILKEEGINHKKIIWPYIGAR